MPDFSNQPKLGYGIYTVTDVAALLGLPVHKVRYWLNKFWDERLAPQPGVRFSWGEMRDKAINFYILIEFYVFYQLREQGVSVGKILRSHQLLSRKFGIPYPFASYKIMTDGRAILFSPDGGDSILNASPSLQYNIPGIIKDFIQKVDFEGESQLAHRFFPSGKTSSVVIDPHRQMGQPTIDGTNILARTLHSMHMAGESSEFIASLYNLQEKQVRDAVEFYHKAA